MLKILLVTGLCMLHAIAAGEGAPQAPKLRVNDQAPPLRVMKWLKGDSVEEFARGHIYIVEFWATWCVPCILEMPHLSRLAKKYKGQVTTISVNVREAKNSKPVDRRSRLRPGK